MAGAFANSKKKGDKIIVDIIDNYESTTNFFNKKFGNTKIIEKKLLVKEE